jgi:type I restriction enzyme S subunit
MMTVVPVSSVASQVRGVSYAKGDAIDVPKPGYVMLLRANNITSCGLSTDDVVYVPESRVTKKQRLLPGDIVVAASSGSLDVVGKAARVTKPIDATFGAFCKVVRPGEGVEPAYLASYFRTDKYRRTISSLAAGANINNLRNEHIDDLELPLPHKNGKPDLDEQKRIAAILDKADAIRRKRQQALRLTDDFLRSVFLDMFGNPALSPKPKKIVPVSEAGNVQLGRQRAPKYQTGKWTRPYMRVANVYENRIDTSDVLSMDFDDRDYESYQLQAGDILLNEGQSTELVGRPAMWRNEIVDCCFQNTLVRFQAHDDVTHPYYALYVFLHYLWFGKFAQVSSKTSSVAHLGAARFAAMPFPLPDYSEQLAFAEIAEEVYQTAKRQTALGDESEDLFASLQQRAFRGEL